MHLVSPACLILALVPFVLVRMARRQTHAAAWMLADWDAVAAVPHTWRTRVRRAPAMLRVGTLAVLAVCAAGPVSQARQIERVDVPARLMVAIDVSGSMLAMDLAPHRFDAARRFAAGIIARRPGDRVGLLAFAGRTAMLCPLTLDHAALAAALHDARAGADELGEGTALGASLVSAIEQLSLTRGAGGRAIVVLTDGAANDERLDPIDAAALAARRGIRIHAVGFGRDGMTRYPTEAGVLDVRLPVRDDVLRRVAHESGGRYWRVTDDAALDGVIAALDAAERPEPMRRERLMSVSRQGPLLSLAIVLLLIELGLTAGPLRVEGV